MLLVRFRHMLGQGGVVALLEAPLMCHNASVAVENIYSIGTEEGFYLFAYKLVRNAIVVLIDIDVIIDIDGRVPEIDMAVPLSREGLQRWPLQSLKELPAAAIEFPELPCIEPLQKFSDPLVEFLDAEKRVVSQGRDYPSGDQQDPGLHLGLVFRFAGTRPA